MINNITILYSLKKIHFSFCVEKSHWEGEEVRNWKLNNVQ